MILLIAFGVNFIQEKNTSLVLPLIPLLIGLNSRGNEIPKNHWRTCDQSKPNPCQCVLNHGLVTYYLGAVCALPKAGVLDIWSVG